MTYGDQKIEQQLIDELSQELAGVAREHIEQAADVILGRPVQGCTMDDLAASLLRSNVTVGQLISALLRCEWITVQSFIEQPQSPAEMRAQVEHFGEAVKHFNGLQKAIISAADRNWRLLVEEERRSRVLAESQNSWHESGSVYLHNYFDEIPVTARAKFLGFEGEHLFLEVNRNVARVFVAATQTDSALISTPDRSYNIHVKFDRYMDGTLGLVIKSIEPALRERRKDVRARLTEHAAVTVDCRGESFAGEIVDISSSGIGITGKGSPSIAVDDAVQCSFRLADAPIDHVPASISWVATTPEGFRAGIQFGPDYEQREKVYKYLFIQEQKIIGRLRQLGVPDWMRD